MRKIKNLLTGLVLFVFGFILLTFVRLRLWLSPPAGWR